MKVTIVGMLTALVLIGLVAFAFYRFSGSLGGAFGLLTSPMTLSITTLALEVVDFVSDALACSNVLNDVRYENFRTAYIFLTTIVSIVFLFGFVERISNVAWQWRKHRSKIKRKMINALSGMARTFRSGSVVMDVDSELRPIKKKKSFWREKNRDELADDLEEAYHDIKAIYARAIILLCEDIPMLAINAYIMITVGKDLAADRSMLDKETHAETMMLLSVIFSTMLGGSKMRNIIFLKKYYYVERDRLKAKIENMEKLEKARRGDMPKVAQRR